MYFEYASFDQDLLCGAPHGLTVGDVSREHRRRLPDQTAVVCGSDRLTYRELDDAANRVANVLQSAGCTDGRVVLWLGQNCHQLFELFLGCAKVGAMVCPVNWRLSTDELCFVIEDLRPDIVIWQEEEVGDRARDVRERTSGLTISGRLIRWFQCDADGAGSWGAELEIASTVDSEHPVNPFSGLLIINTGAFEGRPNPAVLNHLSLLLRGLYEAAAADIGWDYAYLNNGPMFHIGNWRTTMPTYLMGGKNVFIRRVDHRLMCQLIEDEQCTGAYLVPVTRQQMEELNKDGQWNLKSLRDSGGSERWQEMVSPGPSWRGYGQTETGGVTSSTSFGPPAIGTAGRTLPLAQLRVFDDDDREVRPGEVGEIVVRGLTVMNGYLNREQVHARRFRNGWWHTGDLGRRESDGSLTFIGPKLRMLKSASENIYPVEVEQCLASHPAVAECAVIGVPDPRWTQSVKAIVVLRDGQAATEEELIEHCRRNIASYKKPRFIEFAHEIPRVDGAIAYDVLDERYGGGAYPGQG